MFSYKKLLIYVFAVSAAFSATYLSIDLLKKDTAEPPADDNIISTQSEKYTVKHHKGKISVFLGEETEPVYTLDSPYVRDLPEYDRELLETGIVANTKEELIKILEDYDG